MIFVFKVDVIIFVDTYTIECCITKLAKAVLVKIDTKEKRP